MLANLNFQSHFIELVLRLSVAEVSIVAELKNLLRPEPHQLSVSAFSDKFQNNHQYHPHFVFVVFYLLVLYYLETV